MKEQTISNLKKLKSFHNGSYGADIDRAIQALEQQPCEDCISRAEALKAIEKEKQGWEGAERYAIDECHTRIAELPPVTPQQTKFIPVSERMPKKTDYYLIQYSREVCPDEMAVAFYSVEEAGVDSNYTWEFKPIADCKEVIAWMPLPEPYKAESEEEE